MFKRWRWKRSNYEYAVSSVENNIEEGQENKAGRPAQRRESRPTQE